MARSQDKELRWGFTTGTAAAAAAQGALLALLGRQVDQVVVELPSGEEFPVTLRAVEVLGRSQARAQVRKDGGDDPDVTHKALIEATVELLPAGDGQVMELAGGVGVGKVTLPGLDLPVGEPAINPVPRKMIRAALGRAWRAGGGAGPLRVKVTVCVPRGEKLAKRTLNPRLGIIGGISILGTTGLVKPFSHAAYTATIESGLSVAKAMGQNEVVLTTGRRSEKAAMALRPDLPEVAFIQMADYFAYALGAAGQAGLSRVGLVSFFGKAVKQAQGLACTHAHKAPMDLGALARWLVQAGAAEELAAQVAVANTARQAFEILSAAGQRGLAACVGPRLLAQARTMAPPGISLWAAIVDFEGKAIFMQEEGQ